MKKDDIKNSSDMFLYKAIVDFNSAKCLLENFENDEIEIDVDKIYFDFQQSVEKLLKSILTHNKIVFTKTHDLEDLINRCKINNIYLIDSIDILIDLTDFAVEGRYSIICDDLNDSTEYIEHIEKLICYVTKEINVGESQ